MHPASAMMLGSHLPLGGQQAARGLQAGWWDTWREEWEKSQSQEEEIKRGRMGMGERQQG